MRGADSPIGAIRRLGDELNAFRFQSLIRFVNAVHLENQRDTILAIRMRWLVARADGLCHQVSLEQREDRVAGIVTDVIAVLGAPIDFEIHDIAIESNTFDKVGHKQTRVGEFHICLRAHCTPESRCGQGFPLAHILW